MAGYSDTRKMIIDALMGRPEGTQIQPEDHQAFALQIIDYIRSVELVAGNATPIGFADADTVPVQPYNGQAVYLSSVSGSNTVTFTNFIDQNGNAISVTSTANVIKLITLLWNGQYWSSQVTSVNAVCATDGYLFAGVATKDTNPNTPDAKVFYIADGKGVYTNFDGINVTEDEVVILYFDTAWHKEITGIASNQKVSELGQQVSKIRSDVDGQNQEIASFKETITNQVDNFRPIVIEGNVTNAPDEEDITTDASNLLKFANRGTLHGMGYVILRKDKTFAEQVTQANTIYEIRYDFDLGGAALTLPNNITLRYIGGVIKNGTVKGSGLKTMDMPKEQKVLPVFAEGVNFDDNELIASHIGMIEGDIESSINDDILDQVIASGKNLRLDGHFRFNKTHYLDGALSIRGGSLYSKSILFTMREGSSITLEDVTISLGIMYLINCVGNLDYIIDSITVNRCTFKGEVSLVRFYGADVPYITQPHGLRRFVVKDSYIDVTTSFIVLSNLCVTEEFAFIGNVVRNMKYSIIQIGENNDYTNTNDKTDYWADILFEGNDIKGVVSTNGTSYLTPLVSDGQKRVFFRNNVISNIIGTSGQVCYECYASCDEYYCENNVCKNIVHLPSSAMVDTPPEIFKSKASGSLRKAYANRWEIDFAECRDLCRNAGVEWTDEAFANISFISLFHFVGVIGTLDFCDNTIIIKNGRLRLSNSSFSIKEALFKRNNLDIAEVESEWNYLIPVWGKGIERITIQCNNFNVHNGYIVLAGGLYPADSFRSVIVEDNITNFNNFVSEVRSGCDLYVKNNKVLRNEKLDSSPYFILNSNNKINGESFNYFSAGVKLFYISELTNVSWKCNIKHEPSASSFLSLINGNVNKDSRGDYDIIIEADGQKIGYKVRYSDTEMIAYDEWDNILVSSPKVITSSGGWFTVYNSISTQIVFHPDIELGMILQIHSLTEDVGYRNIHIASPKYGIIRPIIANTYTKGAYRFDRTLGKPVWWNGTKWIDATGANV